MRQTKHWFALALVALLLSPASLAQKPITGDSGNGSTATPPTQSNTNNSEDYQQLLLDIIDLAEQATTSMGDAAQQQDLQQLYLDILQMDQGELQLLADHAPPLSILTARLAAAELLFTTTQTSNTRQIEFPEPEVTISQCANVSSTEALVTLGTVFVAEEIITALTWPCLETVLGENDASACTAFEVITEALKITYQITEACLQEQRDAYLDTIIDTEENIADHLNSFIDATTSSRASQDSMDDLQSDVTDSLTLLGTLQTSLDSDLTGLDDELDEVLDDLNELLDDAISLASVADDIQFRVQENQVDVEDAQTRAADAQETAEEIRTDTQSIITSVSTLQVSLSELENSVSNSLAQAGKAALVAALANPESQIIRFQLPQTSGGELESVRELVIATILAFDSVGAKTTDAQNLLTQGDQAYNQQAYLTAYNFFAQAYQALTVAIGATKPGIK